MCIRDSARAAGYIPSQQDARVLMGQEELEIYMVVDIVRFVDPEEASNEEKADSEDKKR